MTAPSPEELTRRRVRCETLGELWATVASGPGLCAPGCACGVGAMFSVGAADIEGDVVAFLQARFTPETEPALARVIAGRALASAWGAAPFGPWLQSLAAAPLEPGSFDLLTDALLSILQSLSEPVAPTGRFVCT